MKKPATIKISDDVWEQTTTNVQDLIIQNLEEHHKLQAENIRLQKRISRLRTVGIFTSIVAVGLLILFALIGNMFVRPYLRMMRAERDVVLPCIYRPAMIYRVKERDTLFGISIFYGVPVEAIASANGITDINRLREDIEITIPESPCVDPAINTRIAAEPLTATVMLATKYVVSTQTHYARMTQNSPTNLTATAVRAETATAQYTPADLIRTTATPTVLDPLELTATDIVGRATQAQVDFIKTSAAEMATPTPSVISQS